MNWITQHLEMIDSVELGDEKRVDRATRDGHMGLTPERVAQRGKELRLGIWVGPFEDSNEDLAA
ncbi:MAG TPA: hypothetical protein VFS76_01890 [Pyrinomonadaceae bacterium]|nr:hypothetical protein [Pyrinomonadaceae bacterium]